MSVTFPSVDMWTPSTTNPVRFTARSITSASRKGVEAAPAAGTESTRYLRPLPVGEIVLAVLEDHPVGVSTRILDLRSCWNTLITDTTVSAQPHRHRRWR